MDRIPAELIERVEIIRSPSANRSGDAVAGALNIVLRDGYSLDGGYVRAGAMLFDDGRVRESLAGVSYAADVSRHLILPAACCPIRAVTGSAALGAARSANAGGGGKRRFSVSRVASWSAMCGLAPCVGKGRVTRDT